jgi:hypothetical protein
MLQAHSRLPTRIVPLDFYHVWFYFLNCEFPDAGIYTTCRSISTMFSVASAR